MKIWNQVSFVLVCGRHLTQTNTKGKCIECDDVICKFCGKIKQGRIVCDECIKDSKKTGFAKYFSSQRMKKIKKYSKIRSF